MSDSGASGPSMAYRPSWTDRLVSLPEKLPGPSWAWYIAIGIFVAVAMHLPAWLSGAVPIGHFDATATWPPLAIAYALALINLLDRIARSSLRQFEPALPDTPEAHQLRRALTTIPDREALVAIVVSELLIPLGYASDLTPVSTFFAIPEALRGPIIIGYLVAIVPVALLVLHTVRQLSTVKKLHAVADHVDLLEPGPLTAFSRLTSATAIGIVLFSLPFFLEAATDPNGGSAEFAVLQGLAFMGLGAASFALPLAGLHDRLAAEKTSLLGAVNARVKATLNQQHQAVDSADYDNLGNLQQQMATLVSQRELIDGLPTWPWSHGTIRGIVSALALPIAIFVLTRLLERAL